MRKLIAFVGKGDYKVVPYMLGDSVKETRFPFYVIYTVFSPEKVFIVSTEEGHEKWFDDIKNMIPTAERIVISMPKKSDDIWDLHSIFHGIIEESDEVLMDITYSFRHIPFMSFSSILYEMRIRSISVLGIFYGAMEAQREDGIVPIFDLSGAMDLVEWHYALSSFIRYGRSQELKSVAEGLRKKQGTPGNLRDYGMLVKIARTIESISDAIYLNQGLKVLHFCASLEENLLRAEETLKDFGRLYPPLKDMLSQLSRFTAMGYIHPERRSIDAEILKKLASLAEYQVDIGLFGESIETLREWLVSYVVYICEDHRDKWLNPVVRYNAEIALGALSIELRGECNDKCKRSEFYYCLKKLDPAAVERLANLWIRTVNIRNLVAHAGMNKENILDPRASKERIMRILNDIDELPR